MGTTDSGAFRESLQPSPAKVCLPVSGQSSDTDRCDRDAVASGSPVCIPATVPIVATTPTSSEGTDVPPTPGVQLVSPSEVGPVARDTKCDVDDAVPVVVSSAPTAALGSRAVESVPRKSPADMYNSEWLQQQGFTQRVIDRIQSARSRSTQSRYKSHWDLFVGWCVDQKLDPFNAGLPLLTNFLTFLFKERGIQVRTIMNYRSSIAHYWRSEIGYEIPEEDKILKDLFKSFKRERPIPHKHVVTWDLGLVLNYLRSGKFKHWDTLSDKDLTLKTVFLFALATGKRRSEIHAVTRSKVRWIQGKNREVELHPSPDFVSKTQLATDIGILQPFTIKSLDEFAGPEESEERRLCPVRSLRYYLTRSDTYRSSEQKRLFISHVRGMSKDVTTATISSYIKETILMAYAASANDSAPSQIKAHSVRHVATSLRALKAVSMSDILRAGAWSTPNVFISFYVQDFSVDSLTELSHLGGFVTAGSRF